MRVQSIAEAKGSAKSRLSNLPKQGTYLKNLYDLFYANKGKRVSRKDMHIIPNYNTNVLGRSLIQLIDFYGCDIRNDTLVGEWCGKVYLDYTKEAEENFNSSS